MTDHSRIEIKYSAIENGRGKDHGFLPIITENGHQLGNTWASVGYDREIALELAKQRATEQAERYCGDWNITIEAA